MRTSPSGWSGDDSLVCDTNIVLSGLLGGTTRQLMFDIDRELLYPEASLEEIKRNRAAIRARSGLETHEINAMLERVIAQLTIVPTSSFRETIPRAATATSPHPNADPTRPFAQRDRGDVIFLAVAIALDADLWSNDGVFKHQDYVRWYQTGDIIELVLVESDSD